MPKYYLSAFFLMFTFLQIFAEIPQHFQHFTEKDGLSSNNVTCILQTSDGFLWVGTDYGLNRFDGHHFKHFLPNNQLKNRTISNEKINALAEDAQGFLWIATNNGLNRYNPKTQHFQAFYNTDNRNNGLPSSMIMQLMIDAQNQLWVICDNRNPIVLNTQNLKFKTYDWIDFLNKTLPEKEKETYKPIYAIHQKNNHEIWLNTKFGVFSFDKKTATFQYYAYQNTAVNRSTNCQNLSYFGTWQDDIWRWDDCNQHWSKITLPFAAEIVGGNRQISQIFKIKKNTYWLLSRQGLLVMENEKIKHLQHDFDNPFSPPLGYLANFFKTKNGHIWLGGENGLWLYDPQLQHFQVQNVVDKNPPVVDNCFYKILDSKTNGQRYVSDVYHNRIYIFDKKRILIKNIQLPNGLTTLLYEDRKGTIWTNSNRQVFTINPQDLQLKPFDFPQHLWAENPKATLVEMAEDSKGRYWWADNSDGLLIADFENKKWTKPNEKQNFIGKNLSVLLADKENQTMWIGGEDYGLFRYDEKTNRFTLYRYEDENPKYSLAGYSVTGIAKDEKGRIWASTRTGGISCFDYNATADKAFFSLSTQNGLPSNEITSLIADKKGRIWASTMKGLACIFPANADNSKVYVFDKKSGLPSDKLDLPISKNDNGDLFLGLKYDYFSFSPDSILNKKLSEKILITNFKVFDTNVLDTLNINYLPKITLSWRQNFFAFTFASINFSLSEKNKYQYRLIGFDKTWQTTDESRRAAYTNVPAGNYWLEVRSGRENQWNEVGFRLHIQIIPPFWQTWWFQGMIICLILAAFYIFYQNKIRQIKKEETLKTAFNQRLAKVEMTALRSQMNPHFIFNCLSSINRFILVNQPEIASEYLTKFARLIRLVLDNSRSELIPLSNELQALRLYIEMEQMRFANRFEFIENISSTVKPEHYEIPPLLIQPFVENAIWHGLMPQEKAGILKIHIFLDNENLQIEIEDNGIGRKEAANYKSQNHQSHATQITQERFEIVRQAYQIDASVDILDLYDDAGTAIGTKVILKLKK